MKYSKLDNDITVSRLCFGCEPLGGSDWGEVNLSHIKSAIDRALDLGVNFFDTADVYGLGLSEERLSSILGSRRYNIHIATKGGVSWVTKEGDNRATIIMDSSPSYLCRAVEDSLRRLKLDRLPIYYLHWPDPKMDMRESFECLAHLQEAGKIGLLGCSNCDATQVHLASEVAKLSLIQLPVNLNTGSLPSDMIDVCSRYHIKVVAYNVLACGLLTGKYDQSFCFPENDRRSRMPLFQGKKYVDALDIVNQVKIKAQQMGLTAAQYAIDWVVTQDCIAAAITGIKNQNQIEQNVGGIR